MGKAIWFRRTFGIGDSVGVTIPAEVVRYWALHVGEEMVWDRDGSRVTVKPLRIAAVNSPEVQAELKKENPGKGDGVWWKRRRKS